MNQIYLDYASTTPVDPEVVKAMKPYFFDQFGNPNSPHRFGQEANKALENSRIILADFIGAKSEEIIFNSGGTEGSNHVIFGVAKALKDRGNHIIISSIEHHCVLEPVQYLEKQGFEVSYINVDSDGLMSPHDVKSLITDKTILICVMHANNEIGTIQPIAEIGRTAREQAIPFFVDAVQTVGHIPVHVEELNVDFLSLSAHKFCGPKGVGALYMRGQYVLPSFIMGGDQERGRRASTQNVAGAVGMAKAVELCAERMDKEIESQTQLRDKLLHEIPNKIDDVKVNGDTLCRLPNNAHFSFRGVDGESLLMSLDMAGVSASMGSACTSGVMQASHVLRGIGLDDDLAYGALRVSIGRWTTAKDVEHLIEQLPTIVRSLRM